MPAATPPRTVADRCRKATFKAPGSPVRGTVRIRPTYPACRSFSASRVSAPTLFIPTLGRIVFP